MRKIATQTDLDQSTVDGIPAGILGTPPPTLHKRGEAGKGMNGRTMHGEEKSSAVQDSMRNPSAGDTKSSRGKGRSRGGQFSPCAPYCIGSSG